MLTAALFAIALSSAPVAVPDENGAAIAAPVPAPAAPGFSRNGKPISYCVLQSMTGSRIPTKVCRTRAQWLEQGFDPLDAR